MGIYLSQQASVSAPEHQAIGAPSTSVHRRLNEHALLGALLAVALFGLAQLARVAQDPNGPSPDESLHLVAGMRAISGNLLSADYIATLSGSLLWPIAGAAGYEIGGLPGARVVALLAVMLAFAGIVFGTRRLFSDPAALFAGISMGVSAPFLVIAHLALMESLAIMGMALCFWSISHLKEDDHRKWVGYAAVALAIAMLAQYRSFLFIFPMAALILVLRGAKGKIDVALLGLTFVLPFIVYYQAMSDKVVVELGDLSLLTPHQTVHDFASADAKRTLILIWGLLPILVGLLAVRLAPEMRSLILVLLAGPAAWTLAMLTFSDLNRSLIYPDLAVGMLLVYPVIGLALSRLKLDTAERIALGLLIVLVGAIGWIQMGIFDSSWPDSRAATDYLTAEMQEGDTLLVNDRWTYALAIYDAGIVNNPDEIVDEASLLSGANLPDLCTFAWFINGEGRLAWSSWVEGIINTCGTFDTALSTESNVTSYGDNLRSQPSTIHSAVLRNSNPYRGTGS